MRMIAIACLGLALMLLPSGAMAQTQQERDCAFAGTRVLNKIADIEFLDYDLLTADERAQMIAGIVKVLIFMERETSVGVCTKLLTANDELLHTFAREIISLLDLVAKER